MKLQVYSNHYSNESHDTKERFCSFWYQINEILSRNQILSLPNSRKLVCAHDSRHYWEVGIDGFPLGRITKDIAKVGFVIENNYSVFEKLYHRFFVLKKMSLKD